MPVSLKTKIIAAVSLLMACLLSTMSFFTFEYFEHEIKRNINKELETMLSALAAQTDNRLLAAQAELVSMSKLVPADIMRTATARDFLWGHRQSEVTFDDGLYLYSPSARLVAGTFGSGRSGQGTADGFSEAIAKTISSRRAIISDPTRSLQEHHHPVIVFTAPILGRTGDVIGVLAGSVDLKQHNFLGALADIKVGEEGYISLFDQSRTIIVHRDRTRILRRDVPPGVNRMFDKALAGYEGTGETVTSRGREVISSFRRLKTVPWILSLNQTFTEAYSPLAKARYFFFTSLLLLVVISVAVSWIFMRYVTAPLARFIGDIRSATSRIEDPPHIPVAGEDEISALAEAFNAMLTELGKRRNAVQEQLRFLQLLIDAMPVPVFYKDKAGVYLGCNNAFAAYLGKRREEIVGKDVFEVAPADLAANYKRADDELFQRRGVQMYESSVIYADGSCHDVLFYKATFDAADSSLGGLVGTILDITERKGMEAALEAQKEFSENLLMNSAVPSFVIDSNHHVLFWNGACEELTGIKASEVVGTNRHWQGFYKEERPLLADIVIHGRSDASCALYGICGESSLTPGALWAEGWFWNINGMDRYILFNAAPIRNSSGELVAVIETLQDITDRKRKEEEIKHALSLLAATLESTADGIIVVDRYGNIVSHNGKFAEMWKLPPEMLQGSAEEGPFKLIRQQLKEPELFDSNIRHLASDERWESFDILHFTDGRIFERFSKPQEVERAIIGRVWSFRDVTEQYRLENQLRHSQKMEAIGTLAGGIAHDFNNMLTAIIGYCGLLEMKLSQDMQLRHYVQQIMVVSERASNLTQSMLASSRKQLTHLRKIGLNHCVMGVARILERIIGEDIAVNLDLAGEEMTITADEGQVEQVLINLATNARDAMPEGGTLTIGTERVEIDGRSANFHGAVSPGTYALLIVADSGYGMDEETVKRIFEPFFTTKDVGKGTGLGLSIIYGIVKKHNGFITCYSELGKGTTFRVYLPLADGPMDPVEQSVNINNSKGSGTILLAEDDGATRLLTKDLLEDAGFTVIEAVDGEKALDLFMVNRGILDLTILDVIMPKMKGKEVYDRIIAVAPETKVLFISGYTADVIHRQGFLDPSLHFLSKPYSPSSMLAKIREVLDK